MTPERLKRAQELAASITTETFQEMCDEVRASLPPTKYTKARYIRNMQGLF